MAYLGIIQEDYCSFLPSLEQSGFTNAFRPTPVVGRVDLASAFFSAELLGKENVAFGKSHASHCALFVRSDVAYSIILPRRKTVCGDDDVVDSKLSPQW
jgi:hypothetical protein